VGEILTPVTGAEDSTKFVVPLLPVTTSCVLAAVPGATTADVGAAWVIGPSAALKLKDASIHVLPAGAGPQSPVAFASLLG
jgi:hypothetical protein